MKLTLGEKIKELRKRDLRTQDELAYALGITPPAFYIEKGHSIYNFVSRYTYYVLGFGSLEHVTPEMVESDWSAYFFDVNRPENNLTPPNGKVKGGGFCLWCDVPSAETEDETLENLTPLIKLCDEKLLGK